MKVSEIRQSFLEFYANANHTIVASSTLVPAGDPTLLFTNAGMVQFKDCFLGTDPRSYVRATTCQKCLRISGKHNDLENVGRTPRHHTFFEMLGNFSFGDYFKKDAIIFAWKFLTETLKLDKERLWITIYESDDEAGKLWSESTDVLPGRILKYGKEDNFWAMGETGPCGPCSEIHYYLGTDLKTQSEDDFRKADGRYIEIWNLVFMQYNRSANGELVALPKPAVDTGMGLERIAAVKQGVRSNYDTDEFRRLISCTEALCGKHYDGKNYERAHNSHYDIDCAFRVIADHARAIAFLIADGVRPGADGRGYVLRRLVRRACRHGRILGFKESFLFKVTTEVVATYGGVYPELQAAQTQIDRLVKAEEEKFSITLDQGLVLLDQAIQDTKQAGAKVVTGKTAFQLHDTYGFPLDLTEDILRNHGLTVDGVEFSREMEVQRERSRAARASETQLVIQRSVKELPTKFVGYEFLEYESEISGLFDVNGEVKNAKPGSEVVIVTRETPFYAESGGQVGDTGFLSTDGGAALDVIDTQKTAAGTIVHICRVVEGEVQAGEKTHLTVDGERRRSIAIHHSSTHLLHLALRDVLGVHATQAGSRVSEQALRFDFRHDQPLREAELLEIENLVNHWMRENYAVTTEVLSLEQAKKSGAMALFGEKYGEQVRVVQIGPRSRELCGGTHAKASGFLGSFYLLNENSISAGVRRIEAVAAEEAYKHSKRKQNLIRNLELALKSPEKELEDRIRKLSARLRDLERDAERQGQRSRSELGDKLADRAQNSPHGGKYIISKVEAIGGKELRELSDKLRTKIQSGCVVLGSVVDGQVLLLTAVTDDLTDRLHAGKLTEELVKIVGGRGGGRADLAQAGGGSPEKLDSALKRAEEILGR